jgi:hypothetical protein
MTTLLPGEPLIYENADGVVYARYRDRPEIARWIIGGDPDAVAKAKGQLLHWGEWDRLQQVANENPALKEQLDKTITLYYLIKDGR